MRVLIISQYFRPQPLANAEVVGGIAYGLADLGYEVDVITPARGAQPHPLLNVRRAIGWFPADRASIPKRLVEYLAFSCGALWGALRAPRPDVVLVPSPPPTLGLVGLAVARLRRAPLVYVIQDLYPEVALATGTVRAGPALRILAWLMTQVYRWSAAVVMIDGTLLPALSGKSGKTPVVAIRNGIDLEPFRAAQRNDDFLHAVGVPDGARVLMYAGNVGRSQDLDLVIAAAAAADAHLIIHGGGAALEALTRRVAAKGLEHVHFSPYRDRTQLGMIFASADLHVVPLKADIASASVPSKLLSIFAAGRPAVLAAESGSAAAAVLEESGGGWLATPGDGDDLAKVVKRALSDQAELDVRATRARTWALHNAGQDRCAREYGALIDRVGGQGSSR